MSYSVAPLARLVEQFERLPGVGRKSAQRLALYVLNMTQPEADSFTGSIIDARSKIHHCSICCNLTDSETCTICAKSNRDKSVICVVEDPRDVMAIEKTHEFDGVYHVLHGVISPMDGIGPEQLKIKELLARMSCEVSEVIMATNPTVEGEATAMYLSRLLKPMGVKCTRLAFGIPVGGDLVYADEVTLGRALDGRSEI